MKKKKNQHRSEIGEILNEIEKSVTWDSDSLQKILRKHPKDSN
jgi:hypothetical protein